MRVAVLGGGGFRTPTLHGCLVRAASEAHIDEVVLQDPDERRLSLILAVIEGLDRERGGAALAVRATTSLDDAVENAGAVLAAIRVGGNDARVVDEEVPLSLGVLGQETVGPAGIAFALRTIPVIRAIADVVEKRAPDAWFVNFTNPAGIVTQAVRDVVGDRAVGICDSPSALCARVASALDRPPDAVAFDYAGLNHLGWLLAARVDGMDSLPELLADDRRLARIDEARLVGPERLRSLGAIPNEYLVYMERPEEVTAAFRRDGARGAVVARQQQDFYAEPPPDDPATALAAWRRARDARHGTYLAEGWAVASWDRPADDSDASEGPGEEGYAAIAAQFLGAVTAETPRRLIVDTANRDRLPGIGRDDVVETTCEVGGDEVRPLAGPPLPPEADDLVARVKEVERLTLLAATTGSAAIALEALAAHPVVPSRDVAERILAGYLRRHASLGELVR